MAKGERGQGCLLCEAAKLRHRLLVPVLQEVPPPHGTPCPPNLAPFRDESRLCGPPTISHESLSERRVGPACLVSKGMMRKF